jgi:hypothetical protein
MYGFAPFVIVTSIIGGLRSLYEGVYTVGECGQGVYFSTLVAA